MWFLFRHHSYFLHQTLVDIYSLLLPAAVSQSTSQPHLVIKILKVKSSEQLSRLRNFPTFRQYRVGLIFFLPSDFIPI